ncbi:MAG TPA: rhodanese-like domain-containing protein [Chloroflexota bacterium]|jgi:rhodanese-related sulfurtransferase|nr:rhodanese-like domain-containing protein [Chloroflexota bacterium]
MPTDIQRDQVQHLRDHGAAVVEVLPREEYDLEHLAGALSLPLHELTRETAERVLGRGQPIVVYCQDVT